MTLLAFSGTKWQKFVNRLLQLSHQSSSRGQFPAFSYFNQSLSTRSPPLLKSSPSKSCDFDPIPTWLLKRLSVQVAPIICRLCNLSLENDVFPSNLKLARVTPLLKKPSLNPDLTNSYRPIFNLSLISKLVERVVAKRFTSLATAINLLPPQQSTYRAHHSTESALIAVHNDLVCSTDNGQVSLLVLLDLSSAFDTVDHEILLTALSTRFGACGTAATWFHSYLEDRQQMFHYSGEASSTYSLDCSVPQGSVLSPIGFISYTEDVVDIINRHRVRSHYYADDMQLYVSCLPDNVGGVMSLLSTCAADIAQWCASRRL
jgi:hypothetical protein